MALVYTAKALIERIQRDVNNGFPDTDFKMSANEILYLIDQAKAVAIVGKSYEVAKIEGNLAVPEAFYVTFALPALTQNTTTLEWSTTLPQPPVSLPLGYSISQIYFADGAYGKSQPVFFLESKRAAYRNFMPKPSGVLARIEGSTVIMEDRNAAPLLGLNAYATMASSRTSDVNEPMNMPDDAIELVYSKVWADIMRRMSFPKDIVKDNLPAGNNNLKQ